MRVGPFEFLKRDKIKVIDFNTTVAVDYVSGATSITLAASVPKGDFFVVGPGFKTSVRMSARTR